MSAGAPVDACTSLPGAFQASMYDGPGVSWQASSSPPAHLLLSCTSGFWQGAGVASSRLPAWGSSSCISYACWWPWLSASSEPCVSPKESTPSPPSGLPGAHLSRRGDASCRGFLHAGDLALPYRLASIRVRWWEWRRQRRPPSRFKSALPVSFREGWLAPPPLAGWWSRALALTAARVATAWRSCAPYLHGWLVAP